MIKACLVTVDGQKRPIEAPQGVLTIQRDTLSVSPTGERATIQRYVWRCAGTPYVTIKIDTPTKIWLDNGAQSLSLGSFGELWIVHGLVLSRENLDQDIVYFDFDSKLWILAADKTRWETVKFSEC